MRIAFFTYSDPAEAGGVQEYTYQLTRALEKRGHRVVIFGPEGKRVLPYKNYYSICRKVNAPSPNGSWTAYTLPFATKPSAAAVINRGHFDLIHINDPWVPFVGYDLIGNVTMPKVATLHIGWEKSSLVSGLAKIILPIFRYVATESNIGVIFVSKHVGHCWRPLVSRKTLTRVIYHGVDAVFRPNGWRPTTSVRGQLLFVGRLVKRKGLKYLLEAMITLVKKYPGLKLDILGDGRERESLTLFTEKHHLGQNVKFYGQIMGQKRVEIFRKAQIFCAPYGDEGFPLAILEAMATGLPIVGFANHSFESLENYPGLNQLARERTAKGIEIALRQLLEDRLLQEKIRKWQLSESVKYTWDRAAAETEKFYWEILKKRA